MRLACKLLTPKHLSLHMLELPPLRGPAGKRHSLPATNCQRPLPLVARRKISIKNDRFFAIFKQKSAWHTGCLGDHRHFALCAAHKGTKAGGARTLGTPNIF